MALDTTVKYIHSGMAGTPAVSGNSAGSLLTLLNTVLVNGTTPVSVDSIVVSAGIATVNKSTGHPFEVHQVTKIAGATPSGLNGEKRILSITATSYTFDAAGISDQTATGTLTHCIAPLGWVKPYSDSGNVGVFKSPNLASTGCILRVDDSGAQSARVRGYETMTALSAGLNRFPEDNVVSGGGYWPRSSTNDATARPWAIVGNDRFFFFIPAYYNGSPTLYPIQGAFGDYLTAKPSGNAYACVLHAPTTTSAYSTTPGNAWELAYFDVSTAQYISSPRDYRGITGPRYMQRVWSNMPTNATASTHFSGGGGGQYPAAIDNGLYVSPVVLWENHGPYIGMFPGLYCTSQSVGTAFASHQTVKDAVGMPGNRILKVFCSTASNTAAFLDITGPWH